MKSVSGFDPTARETLENPYPFYEALREQAPVHWAPELGYFMISRYDDARDVLRDPALFSSQSGPAAMPPPPEALEVRRQGYPEVATLLTNDPPEHIRFRSLVSRAFAPRRVSKMESQIRDIANSLVDRFANQGEVEIVEDFAVPFPLTIIAQQLGVPLRDMDKFKRWSDDAVAPLGGMISKERQIECAHSIVEFQRYFERQVEARRADPRDDILTQVVEAKLEGVEPLDTAEILSILQQFLVAGNETTTKLLASGVLLLLLHPDQLQRLRDDPSLIPNAVEEIARLESPVQGLFRLATRDTELRGVPIPAGSRLQVLYASANRDPAQFPDPHRFDVARENARTHLAFGLGEHFCIGAGLARQEGKVALETLLERLKNPRLSPRNEYEHTPSLILRGLEELHVEFDPA